MKVTIKTIAERSGVSIGTVDRVLHDRPNVKPAVREHVLSVIRELEYRPNKVARALANSERTITVAAVFPSWTTFFQDKIEEGLRTAEEELADFNLRLERHVYEQRDHQQCLAILQGLKEKDVTAISLCAENSVSVRELIDSFANAGVPVVTFNSDITPSRRLCFVGQDPLRSGRVAGELIGKYLYDDERILVVLGNYEYSAHKARVDGFCQRMEEIGVSRDRLSIIECYNEYAITLEKVYAILKTDPTIRYIYMANRSVSGCVEALRKLDLAGKVRVVCHDVSEKIRDFMRQGLVDFTIDQDIYAQGYRPIVLLADYCQSYKTVPREFVYTTSNIVNVENIDPLL